MENKIDKIDKIDNIDRIIKVILGASISTWFISSIYLSIVYLIGNFTEVNPTTSKDIFAYSFLVSTTMGIYSKCKNLTLDSIRVSFKNLKTSTDKKEGCTSCKQKKKG